MKHTLSDADRLELKSKMKEWLHVHADVGSFYMDGITGIPSLLPTDRMLNEMCERFSEFYESKNTFSDGIEQEPEEEPDDPQFKGVAYEKDIDQKALQKGFYKVFEFLAEHPEEWFLDLEISDGTGVYVPSVQRYRSYCRQPEFGGHIINRRRRAGMRIWEYTMIPNEQSKIFAQFVLSRA